MGGREPTRAESSPAFARGLAGVGARPRPRVGVALLLAAATTFVSAPTASAQTLHSPEWAQRLLRQTAENEVKYLRVRGEYTYVQDFSFEEIQDEHHRRGGRYAVTTDVTFTPEGQRLEKNLRGPFNSLRFVRMSKEDFRNLRSIVPYVLTPDKLRFYWTRYRGDETVPLLDAEGRSAGSVLAARYSVSPLQMYKGQRYFEGDAWLDPQTLGIVKLSGRAVPSIRKMQNGRVDYEDLFAKFTTYFQRIDGRYWFPVYTEGDDWLDFSIGAGPIEVHETVRFLNYRRFGATGRLIGTPQPAQPPPPH
jgi:hypothetical protein